MIKKCLIITILIFTITCTVQAVPTVYGSDLSRLNDIAFGNGTYISVGTGGIVKTSKDGKEWKQADSGTENNLNSIKWMDNRFIAVGDKGTVITSADGERWGRIEVEGGPDLEDIVWGNGMYVAVGERSNRDEYFHGAAVISKDGISWTEVKIPTICRFKGIAWNGERFAAVGENWGALPDGEIFTSEDGVSWTRRVALGNIAGPFFDVIWANGEFIAVGGSAYDGSTAYRSADGVEWRGSKLRTLPFHDIEYANGIYIGSGVLGCMYISEDGDEWKLTFEGMSTNIYGIAYGDERIITVGEGETVYNFDAVELKDLRIDGEVAHADAPAAVLADMETTISVNLRHFYKTEEQMDVEFYYDSVSEETLIGKYNGNIIHPGEEITASVKWTPSVSGKVKIIAKVNGIPGLFKETQVERTFDVCSIQPVKQVREAAKNGEYVAIRGIASSGNYSIKDGSAEIEIVVGSNLPIGSDVIVTGILYKLGGEVRIYGYKVIELGSVDKIENDDGSVTEIDRVGDKVSVHYSKNAIEKHIQKQSPDRGGEIVLELETAGLKQQELVIDAEAVSLINEQELKLKIRLGYFTVTVPEAAIKTAEPAALKVELGQKIDNDINDINNLMGATGEISVSHSFYVSQIITFNFSPEDRSGTYLSNEACIEFDMSHVYMIDIRKRGIYYLDQEKQWVYAGGSYDAGTKSIRGVMGENVEFAAIGYISSFSDIAGSWAKEAIEILAAKQIVTGVNRYTFAPWDKLTRAQFAAFIVRALKIDFQGYSDRFADCREGVWYTSYVEAAERAGLVKGAGNGKFYPDAYITREEMAVLAKRAYDYMTQRGKSDAFTGPAAPFKDMNEIESWAAGAVDEVRKLGIIQGMPDGNFKPKDNCTREEAAIVIVKLIEIAEKTNSNNGK